MVGLRAPSRAVVQSISFTRRSQLTKSVADSEVFPSAADSEFTPQKTLMVDVDDDSRDRKMKLGAH